MSFTLTTEAEAVKTAGANANSTITADSTTLARWSDQAEGIIGSKTRRTWIDDYSSLSTEIKGILNDVAASLIAMKIIHYDMSGFTSRQEAGTMLDFLDERVSDGLNVLKDFKSSSDLRSAI